MSEEYEEKLETATEKLAELVKPEAETVVEDKVEPEAVEYTDEEKRAIDFGWKPEGVEGKEPKSASQFLNDFEVIKAKRKNKELQHTVDFLVEQQKTIKQKTYEQALADLAQQRMEAVQLGESEQFNQIDRRYQELQQEAAKATEVPDFTQQSEVSIQLEEFQERNKSWYNANSFENATMSKYATMYENDLAVSFPDMTIPERLKKVEAEVRTRYPEHPAFKNAKRDIPPKVNTSDSRSAAVKTMSERDLHPQDRQMFKLLKAAHERNGNKYTIEDFTKARD